MIMQSILLEFESVFNKEWNNQSTGHKMGHHGVSQWVNTIL